MEDPTKLSTAELKRALTAQGVDPARLAQCIERPDYEQLYRDHASLQPKQRVEEQRPRVDEPAVANTTETGVAGMSWQTIAMFAFGLYYLLGNGGGGGGSSEPHSPADTAYIHGHVAEITNLPALKEVMALHKDGTGLPVVLDFYSPSCGPCRMIAPKLKALADEYKGRAAFIKVDVNSAYDIGSEYRVRAMPTFHFYHNGNLAHSFQGADSRSLVSTTEQLARRAENAGTYVKREVTSADLRAFYATHEPAKIEEVDDLVVKYGANKTAKLIRILRSKYKAEPTTTEIKEPDPPPPPPSADGAATSLGSASVAELAAELQRRQEQALAVEQEARAAAATVAPPYTSPSKPASVIIIGAGPAGLSAAIYAARAGLNPIVIAPTAGGQLEGKGVDVENFPGVVGASGPSLVSLMRTQAAGFNATVVSDVAVGLDTTTRPFRVRLNATAPLHSRAVIVALGAESKWLGVDGEYEYRGGGVSSCATCDGFLFRDKPVLVVGGGDSAMEEALVLARTSSHVTLVHRGAKLRASHAMAARVLGHPKITVRYHMTVSSFGGTADENGANQLSHVSLLNHASGAPEIIHVAAAFIAIGHQPNTAMLRGSVKLRDDGYIDMSSSGRSMHTSCAGLFAAGDVADPYYRQAVTSAGSGAAAALDVERWLSEGGGGANEPCRVDEASA